MDQRQDSEDREKRSKRAIELGPTGVRVAENVKEIRAERGLTTRALADRMEKIGRPFPSSAVTKIEAHQRRVDVDDLVALALVLDATPNRLLLPPTTRRDVEVELTSTEHTSAGSAWGWASDAELPLGTWPPQHGDSTIAGRAAYERRRRFRLENNPGLAEPNVEDYRDHLESIVELRHLADQVVADTGLTMDAVVAMAFGARIFTSPEG